MDEIINFLNDAQIYYLATINGDKPSVRPIGFVMNYNGKLTFSTTNNKNMYEQMKNNSNVEISVFSKGQTLRLSGKAIFNTSEDSIAKVFETMPELKKMYGGNEQIMETFYIENAKATIATMGGELKEISL